MLTGPDERRTRLHRHSGAQEHGAEQAGGRVDGGAVVQDGLAEAAEAVGASRWREVRSITHWFRAR